MSKLARQMRRRRVPAKQRKYVARTVLLDGRRVPAEDVRLYTPSSLSDIDRPDIWMAYRDVLLAPGQTVTFLSGRVYEQPFAPAPEWVLEALRERRRRELERRKQQVVAELQRLKNEDLRSG